MRIDLTQTLYLTKDDDVAKYQAEMLIASGIDDRIGDGLKNIVGEIDRRRPVRFRAFGSLLPNTNINNGTDKRIIYIGGLPFVIDGAARRKSGIGLLLGGDVLLRHGWRAELSGFYDYFVAPSRFVRFIGGGIHEHTQTEAFSFDELSGGLGFYNEFPMGFTLYAQAIYARRSYDAPMAVFGTREDNRYEVQATITKRDLNFHGLAPQLTYSFVRNVSTLPFEDYTAHGVDIRLVKAF